MNFPFPIEADILGGANYFYFVPVDQVVSVSRPQAGNVSLPITLQPGSLWLSGYASYDSLSLDSRLETDGNGGFYESSVKGFYPKPSAPLVHYLNSVKNNRFLVLIKDSNGSTRIVGSQSQPCSFSFSERTGSKAMDVPGIAFEFKSLSYIPPLFYSIGISAPDPVG